MKLEKTKNTIRNTIWGTLNRGVTLLGEFVIRTCIIYCLGAEYTGLTSLFSSILHVLSFAELGFGTAIVYSMYQPIADEDDEKVCALMNLYKWIYRIIGVVVILIGVVLIPFLPKLIKGDAPADINLYILYGIYLFNSASSYWLFSYKNCLLTAFQRNDVSNNVASVINIIQYVAQVVILIALKNYYAYAVLLPVATVIKNIVTAHYVTKMFPKYKSMGKISKPELKSIGKQVAGLMSQRLAFQSRNSFDSIIISKYLGLTVVAMYTNYFYLISAATNLLSMVFTSMQGGIGNSIAKESIKKNYDDFRRINFLYMWISGVFTVFLAVLYQPFIKLWVGENLMLSNTIAILMAYYFLFMKYTDTIGAYISATGLWWNCKKFYLFEGLTNLILNIGLGYFFGVFGVILATIISVVFLNFIPTMITLHKNFFVDFRVKIVFKDDIIYFVVITIAIFITYFVCKLIPETTNMVENIVWFATRVVACIIIPNIIFFVCYSKNSQFISSRKWLANSSVFFAKYLTKWKD